MIQAPTAGLGLCPGDSGMPGSFRLLPKHQSFIVSAEAKGVPFFGVMGCCSEGVTVAFDTSPEDKVRAAGRRGTFCRAR